MASVLLSWCLVGNKEYYKLLNKRLWYLQKLIFDSKMKKLMMLNKDREFFQYT